MGISKETARNMIGTYIKAWEEQDPDLIVTIFAAGATYHESVLGDPIPDREAIRAYWQSKVVEAQADISCRLVSLYVDGMTAIAEWVAEFDDVVQGVRKRMKEIAVLEFEWTMEHGYLITSLREYWASETLGPDAATRKAEAIRYRDEHAHDIGVALVGKVSMSSRRAEALRGGDAVE